MSNISKTARAAMNAVEKGQQKAKVERTPAQILKDIRNHLDAKLAVTPDDVRFLLSEYDMAQKAVTHLGEATAALLKRAELAETLNVVCRDVAVAIGTNHLSVPDPSFSINNDKPEES